MTDFRTFFRDFAWRDVFPWLILVRAFRLSWHPGMVGLALAAALVTTIGWRISGFVFLPAPAGSADSATASQAEVLARSDAAVLSRFPGQDVRPPIAYRNLSTEISLVSFFRAALSDSAPHRAYSRLLRPLGGMVRTQSSLRFFCYYLFGVVWTVAAWAVAGGAITRVALVDLGREEHVPLKSAIRLALSRFGDYLAAPLYPLAGVAVTAIPIALLGLLMRFDAGAFVVSLLWIVSIIVGMFAAMMLLWLAVGWPLMWCAIGAKETGDAFEGMSQSFSFSFSRPLHYLFYATVAWLLGALAWTLVGGFVDAGIELARHAASWGGGSGQLTQLAAIADGATLPDASGTLSTAGKIIGFFEWFAFAVADAWCYSYFWVLAAGVFLLLRYDAERAELDDVWLPSEGEQALPPVSDADGVAEVRPAQASAASSEPNTAE